MPYENPRKTRLLKEALGDESAPPPSVAQTCWTIGLIAAAVTIIALAGVDLPENNAAFPIAGLRHAELTLPIARIPAGAAVAPAAASETPTTAESGNVVDLTY
jgi:hypothetical protein